MKRSTMAWMAAGLALAGCATAPLAPRVAVMPAPGKPFEVFVAEEQACRQYAEQAVATADGKDPATERAVETGIWATLIGALAGAAIGGRDGAAVGAGFGLFTGAATASGESHYVVGDVRHRYDIAYQQCMYAKGNQIPGMYRPQVEAGAPANRAAPMPPPPTAAAPAKLQGMPPPPPSPSR